MASLSLAASAPGWESSIRAMRAMPKDLKSQVTRKGRTLAEPLAKEIRAEGNHQGGQAARVADTVQSSMSGGVPTVKAGGRLPFTMGSEWGGGQRQRTYYGRSPLGNRYLIIQRHTTRQFRQHRGGEGYWFTPAISAGGHGREAVLKAWAALVDEVIRDF